MNEEFTKKADILVEAMPYISRFHGKIFVIKYGGSIINDEEINKSVIRDICFLKTVGIKIVIVHGGGKTIDSELDIHSINRKFINGLRYTDSDTLNIAEMVLSGNVNKKIVNYIQQNKVNAIGISGRDGELAKAVKRSEELGYVGRIVDVNTNILNILLQNDYIPVISPICCGDHEEYFNINADEMAVEIAKALRAEKLIFLSDIDGIYKNINDKNSLISKIKINEIDNLIKDGVIYGGMIPKVTSCANAIKEGIKAVHIINGKVNHSMLLEIYTNNGIGSLIEE